MIDKISNSRLEQLQHLIQTGNEAQFYWWPEWSGANGLRWDVLRMDHYECQLCKARGRYSKGRIVHHVKHLRDRPDLALSLYDPETRERQLITVCKTCHELEHPESLRQNASKTPDLTPERWD